MKHTFTTKEEYLAYRSNWKAQYKELSKDIRDLKFCRSFPQAHRFENPKSVERYREIEKRLFNNPNTCVEWKLIEKRVKAFRMLEELKEAKKEAQNQYIATKAKELEAVLA
jgi:hypothetical protein